MTVDTAQRWAMWLLLAIVAIGSTTVYEARISRIQRENDREFARETLGLQRELIRFLGSGIDQQQQQQQDQWVVSDSLLASYLFDAQKELQDERRRRPIDSRHQQRAADVDGSDHHGSAK